MKIIIIHKVMKMKKLPSIIIPFLFMLGLGNMQAAELNTVDLYNAKVSNVNQSLLLTGTVEAKQNAGLASLQAGVVAELFVEVGDKVAKGQKLLALDAKLAELSLIQVKAQKSAAMAEKAEAERLYIEVINLSKQQLVAETLLGERLSRLEIAKSELGRVDAELIYQQEILARHTLYAPFAGIIAQRQVNVGEWVTQQSQVLTLVEQANMRLNLAIPQEYFIQLNNNANVDVVVTPDVIGAPLVNARLDRLVAVASNSSRTVTGLVELPNDFNWIAGMSAKANIKLPTNSESLVWLPKSAIKQHPDGGSSVFVVENSQAKRVLVKIVKTQDEQVAVSGAKADKPFVVSGVELLQSGDKVKVRQIIGDAL